MGEMSPQHLNPPLRKPRLGERFHSSGHRTNHNESITQYHRSMVDFLEMGQESLVACTLHLEPGAFLFESVDIFMSRPDFQELYPEHVSRALCNAVQQNMNSLAATTTLTTNFGLYPKKHGKKPASQSGDEDSPNNFYDANTPDEVKVQGLPSIDLNWDNQHTSQAQYPLGTVGEDGSTAQQKAVNPKRSGALIRSIISTPSGISKILNKQKATNPAPNPASIRPSSAASTPSYTVNIPGIPPFHADQLRSEIRGTGKLKLDGTFDGAILNNHYNAFLEVMKRAPLPPRRPDAQGNVISWHKQRTAAIKALSTKFPHDYQLFLSFVRYCRASGISAPVATSAHARNHQTASVQAASTHAPTNLMDRISSSDNVQTSEDDTFSSVNDSRKPSATYGNQNGLDAYTEDMRDLGGYQDAAHRENSGNLELGPMDMVNPLGQIESEFSSFDRSPLPPPLSSDRFAPSDFAKQPGIRQRSIYRNQPHEQNNIHNSDLNHSPSITGLALDHSWHTTGPQSAANFIDTMQPTTNTSPSVLATPGSNTVARSAKRSFDEHSDQTKYDSGAQAARATKKVRKEHVVGAVQSISRVEAQQSEHRKKPRGHGMLHNHQYGSAAPSGVKPASKSTPANSEQPDGGRSSTVEHSGYSMHRTPSSFESSRNGRNEDNARSKAREEFTIHFDPEWDAATQARYHAFHQQLYISALAAVVPEPISKSLHRTMPASKHENQEVPDDIATQENKLPRSPDLL